MAYNSTDNAFHAPVKENGMDEGKSKDGVDSCSCSVVVSINYTNINTVMKKQHQSTLPSVTLERSLQHNIDQKRHVPGSFGAAIRDVCHPLAVSIRGEVILTLNMLVYPTVVCRRGQHLAFCLSV